MSYLKQGTKTGKLSNLGFLVQGQKKNWEHYSFFLKREQYNNTNVWLGELGTKKEELH